MLRSDGLARSMRRFNENHRLDVLRNITDLLSRTFTSQFVFPVLGHEDGQSNNFRHLGELWRLWLPSEALQTFEKGKIEYVHRHHTIFHLPAIDQHSIFIRQNHFSNIYYIMVFVIYY